MMDLAPTAAESVSRARLLQAAGCQLLALTTPAASPPTAWGHEWARVRAVKSAVGNMRVLAHTPVATYAEVRQCLTATGGDGVVSSIGVLHSPDLFRDAPGLSVSAAVNEYLALCSRHGATASAVRHTLAHLWHASMRSDMDVAGLQRCATLRQFRQLAAALHAPPPPVPGTPEISARKCPMPGGGGPVMEEATATACGELLAERQAEAAGGERGSSIVGGEADSATAPLLCQPPIVGLSWDLAAMLGPVTRKGVKKLDKASRSAKTRILRGSRAAAAAAAAEEDPQPSAAAAAEGLAAASTPCVVLPAVAGERAYPAGECTFQSKAALKEERRQRVRAAMAAGAGANGVLRVAVDLSMDAAMSEKEVASLCDQIRRIYGDNLKSEVGLARTAPCSRRLVAVSCSLAPRVGGPLATAKHTSPSASPRPPPCRHLTLSIAPLPPSSFIGRRHTCRFLHTLTTHATAHHTSTVSPSPRVAQGPGTRYPDGSGAGWAHTTALPRAVTGL